MLAHRFKREMLAGLVQAGPCDGRDRDDESGRREVERYHIEDGRDALAG
jgi:hypothetical protein